MALITFLFALNLPIDADGILGETTKSIQNMLSSLVRVLWAVAFMELCAAGFIAYVIYTLKLQEEK